MVNDKCLIGNHLELFQEEAKEGGSDCQHTTNNSEMDIVAHIDFVKIDVHPRHQYHYSRRDAVLIEFSHENTFLRRQNVYGDTVKTHMVSMLYFCRKLSPRRVGRFWERMYPRHACRILQLP